MDANSVLADELTQAVRTAEELFSAANPLSRARHERARRVLPAGHSRQTLHYPPFPVTIVRGKNARVTDLDGHEYLNLVGEYSAGVLGHTCEPVQRAVREALDNGVFLSGVNTKEVEYAEYISRRIPSIQNLRFCNSGSEACLFSVLIARHATNRTKILVFKGCYHGGFLIYGDIDPPLSVPFEVVKVPYNDIDATRAALEANAGSIAAVIVEPMMGSAGAIPGTNEFLKMLRTETERIGALLIFDEVLTSRLAPGGLQGVHGITPDITTLGKFWGGGFAFGAFGGSREVMRHLDLPGGGKLSQAGTFNNNIVTLSAGLVAARDVYTPEACIELNARGDRLRKALADLGAHFSVPLQTTGIGGVFNLHWHNRLIRKASDVEPSDSPRRRLFHLEMMLQGYYVAQRGTINMSMPVTQDDESGFVDAVRGYLSRHRQLLFGD